MKACIMTTDKREVKRTNQVRAYPLNEKDMPVGKPVPEIIEFLDVEKSARYKQKLNDAGQIIATFCNIYAFDVANLFGAYLPRVWWKDPKSITKETKPEYGKNCYELNADQLYSWFKDHSVNFGWQRMNDMREAQSMANRGKLVVIVADRKEAGKSGHITVIAPEGDHGKATVGSSFIPLQSQAGSTNKKYFNSAWYLSDKYIAWGCWVFNK